MIDVLWVSRHPDTVMARGYADEGLLDELLSGTLWRIPFEFRHHEVLGEIWPDVDGAIVVLPARHHAHPDDVSWFRERLDTLRWSLVVLAGDEEWTFPWQEIPETDSRKVWIMQPRPEHAHLSGLIPGGWSPGTREAFRRFRDEADERLFDWSFAGQVTHRRRQDCVAILKRLPNGRIVETEGYMQGIPIEAYRNLVASSKVIPCPSGPMTVDTNRPLEAMECGAVPVVDTVTPRGETYDYWGIVFGDDHPLPTVSSWREFPGKLARAVHQWPAVSNRVFAFWQQWKRNLAHKLTDQVRELSDVVPSEETVTVIVTTSPIESHPETKIIEETIESIRAQLPEAEIIIVADGVRQEQEHLRHSYDEYIKRLLWLTNFEWKNVVPIVRETWGHQANATRAALELVRTPQILFVEHDTPLMGEIDWTGLMYVIESGEAEAIRFHFDVAIHPDHEHLMLDRTLHPYVVVLPEDRADDWRKPNEVPLLRTVVWWQRPHLASTAFYRDKVMPLFSETSRTMIEDYLHGIVENNWRDNGKEEGWRNWRLFIYAPEGDIKRSGHLDARGAEPKFGMRYQ